MGFLALLGPIITRFIPSLQTLLDYKAKQVDAKQVLELAKLKAQTDAIVSGNQSTTDQTRDKLNATTQNFKQSTFYLLILPIIFSVFCPEKAAVMWANFEAIPVWFRTLFGAVYCTIWGIPLATGYIGGIFSGVGAAIKDGREYRLKKAEIDKAAVFDEMRVKLFPKGMTQAQVDAIDDALDKG